MKNGFYMYINNSDIQSIITNKIGNVLYNFKEYKHFTHYLELDEYYTYCLNNKPETSKIHIETLMREGNNKLSRITDLVNQKMTELFTYMDTPDPDYQAALAIAIANKEKAIKDKSTTPEQKKAAINQLNILSKVRLNDTNLKLNMITHEISNTNHIDRPINIDIGSALREFTEPIRTSRTFFGRDNVDLLYIR